MGTPNKTVEDNGYPAGRKTNGLFTKFSNYHRTQRITHIGH